MKPSKVALLRLLLLTSLMVVNSQSTCEDPGAGYTLSCNTMIDPWIETRDKLDVLVAGSEAACGRNPVDDGSSIPFDNNVLIETGESRLTGKSVRAEDDQGGCEPKLEFDMWNGDKKKTGSSSRMPSVNVNKAAGSKQHLMTGLQVLGVLASTLQVVGPIMDIVLMFMPQEKSMELQAIESGFAKMGAKFESVTVQLDNIEGAIAWNTILDNLLQLESKVDVLLVMYNRIAVELDSVDQDREIPSQTTGKIETLVTQIGEGLAYNLNTVVKLFKGESALTEGKTILDIYMSAVDNDCSRILKMAYRIIQIVKDAQKLMFFYEINQQLTQADDDNYSGIMYQMYAITSRQFTECTISAASRAQEVRVTFYKLLTVTQL